MKANFKITSFTEIEFGDKHIDLHNCFDFIPDSYKQVGNEVKFQFEKSKGDWISKDECKKLTFTLIYYS